MRVLIVVLIFLLMNSSISKSEETNLGFWRDLKIEFSDIYLPEGHLIRGPVINAKLLKFQKIPCILNLDTDTKYRKECYKTPAPKSDFPVYGLGLKFVEPIALIPFSEPENWTEQPEDDEENTRSRPLKDYTKKEIEALEPYKFITKSKNQETKLTNSFRLPKYEDTGYSLANKTQGGSYALGLYERMSGVEPTRLCIDVSEPCSIILEAKVDDRPSYLYCQIFNSEVGMGLPFNCELLAFQGKAGWYVYSHLGPEQCDGCGAGAGATCIIDDSTDLKGIAELFEEIMHKSKIGIKLKRVKETKSEIKLIGKATLKNSEFFKGYYENSYAVFHIDSFVDGDEKSIRIDGIYNLLISAEPSRDTKNFRDIQSNEEEFSSIQWLQLQVQKIVEEGLKNKIEKDITCYVMMI